MPQPDENNPLYDHPIMPTRNGDNTPVSEELLPPQYIPMVPQPGKSLYDDAALRGFRDGMLANMYPPIGHMLPDGTFCVHGDSMEN